MKDSKLYMDLLEVLDKQKEIIDKQVKIISALTIENLELENLIENL